MAKSKNVRKMSGATKRFIAVGTIPTFLLYFVFVLFPIVQMFYYSFFNVDSLLRSKTFAGFSNFTTLFHDEKFWMAFRNTIYLIVVVTVVTFFLAMLFASMLAKSKIKGKSFFRIVFYIPNILSIVVISAIFSMLYDSDAGIIGPIVRLFNKDFVYTGVLGDPNKVVKAIAIAMIWQAVGYYMVMYLAAMDSISDELYESAGLDGAGKVCQFFNITLPMTWQVVRVTLTFFIISTINMSFLFINSMTQGKPGGASNVLLMYMAQNRQGLTFGYSMAIGTVLFVFAYVLALIVNKLTSKDPLD